MKLVLEPADHDRYLTCLNECFPGWGTRAMYDWCFARTATGPAPERLVITDDAGQWVAGTAISYRTMRSGGQRWLAGVMTGSWTLPAARGQGIFPRFIEETRARVAHHGGVAVLGFAGDLERASTRKLKSAGSRCVPSWHALGEAAAASEAARRAGDALVAHEATEADAERAYARFRERDGTRAGFVYDDLASFVGQMFRRSLPVLCVDGGSVAPSAVAVVERAKDTDRVLLLDAPDEAARVAFLRALHGRAAGEGRKVFAFGVGEKEKGAFEAAGLPCKGGFLTILEASDSADDRATCDTLATLDWDYQSGDRM